MIRPPGAIGCPRIGPNGGIVIRSAQSGVEVEVGGLAPSAPATFKTWQFGALEDPIAALDVVPDSVIEFTAGQWAIGQAVFVESVFQIQGTSDGSLEFEFWWSGDGIDWEPFYQPLGVPIGLSEGSVTAPWAMQAETPFIDENWESTSVFVALAIGRTGTLNANITVGHILAQMFVPQPEP